MDSNCQEGGRKGGGISEPREGRRQEIGREGVTEGRRREEREREKTGRLGGKVRWRQGGERRGE